MDGATWIVVLIKDFSSAKTRLAPALAPDDRASLARANAARALDAALAVAPTVAVCGSADAALLARRQGAQVIREAVPRGQNMAAARGLADVAARGALAALLLSSDLPLVTATALRGVLHRASGIGGALMLAVPALGREGTNALYLRPPTGATLHFGNSSLPRFQAEARRRRRRFLVHEDRELALDIDEPADIAVLHDMRRSA